MSNVTAVLNDPTCQVYISVGAVYICATLVSRYFHKALWICYLLTAAVYLAAAVIHFPVERQEMQPPYDGYPRPVQTLEV
jgi:hypothetical protein